MSLITEQDPLAYARLLALSYDQKNVPDEAFVQHTVNLMNEHLCRTQSDRIGIFKATEAYILPTDQFDLEFMSEQEIASSKIPNPMMQGRLYDFSWLGSVTLSGFGARLFGVSFYEPQIKKVNSVFIPVSSIGLCLAK